MDERDLPKPVVREGEIEENSPNGVQNKMSLEERIGEVSRELFEEENDFFFEERYKETSPELPERDVPAPAEPDRETEINIPKAPNIWMDKFQLEEVEAQGALMRDVVSKMLPTPEAILEANTTSEFALLMPDEISRMEAFAHEEDHEKGLEIGLGDE